MEFNLVQTTPRAPFNTCYLCGDYEGPFIDCFKDQFGHGAVFICATKYNEIGQVVKPGCVGQMAKAAGMVYEYEIREIKESLSRSKVEITNLQKSQIVEIPAATFAEMMEQMEELARSSVLNFQEVEVEGGKDVSD